MDPKRSHDPDEAPRKDRDDEDFVPGPLDDPSEADDADEAIDDPDDEDEGDIEEVD
jgi:hypothetical protein